MESWERRNNNGWRCLRLIIGGLPSDKSSGGSASVCFRFGIERKSRQLGVLEWFVNTSIPPFHRRVGRPATNAILFVSQADLPVETQGLNGIKNSRVRRAHRESKRFSVFGVNLANRLSNDLIET